MQGSWHELASDGIAVGAKLEEILHNLSPVVDRRPVEESNILLQKTEKMITINEWLVTDQAARGKIWCQKIYNRL